MSSHKRLVVGASSPLRVGSAPSADRARLQDRPRVKESTRETDRDRERERERERRVVLSELFDG